MHKISFKFFWSLKVFLFLSNFFCEGYRFLINCFLWKKSVPTFPHKAWVDPKNRFSDKFPVEGLTPWHSRFRKAITSSICSASSSFVFGFTSNLYPVFYNFPHSFPSPSLSSIFDWPIKVLCLCSMFVVVSRLTLYIMLFRYLHPLICKRDPNNKIKKHGPVQDHYWSWINKLSG